MLYLITGANGAGKTLNTLKWVQERAVKENRPVAHNGRFEPVEGGEISNWKRIDPTKWQDEPDGTIFVIDECHNDFPLRAPSSMPPEHVRMLAEHRRRGFDFYLITQHPQNIDSFVRRLIGSPGWHRHLKRAFGADLVSVLEWSAVNAQCEKPGSGKSGTVTMQAFPKDVYGWYRSASLHTGKKKLPRALWFVLAAVLLIPVVLAMAYSAVNRNISKDAPQKFEPSIQSPMRQVSAKNSASSVDDDPMEYLRRRVPRLPEFPHTAPIYDEVTKPAQAPYPAACVSMGERCDCYTQQGTRMRVVKAVCLQIVEIGFFVDWQRQEPPRERQSAMKPEAKAGPSPEPREPVRVVEKPAEIGLGDVPEVVRQGTRSQWAQELARRNDSVRSQLVR